MNETMVTVVGHVATEPTLRMTPAGARVGSFRLASTERRFDRGAGGWRDGSTTFFTVTTWRNMAENVCGSVEKGQPVVVHGRLKDASYDTKDGQHRTVLEIDAFAVGHDLRRGVARFTKSTMSASVETNVVRDLEQLDELEELEELARLERAGALDPLTGEVYDTADHDDQTGRLDRAEPADPGGPVPSAA
jgi:single-strand DNA-binding protein